jgi:hypothetical protein
MIPKITHVHCRLCLGCMHCNENPVQTSKVCALRLAQSVNGNDYWTEGWGIQPPQVSYVWVVNLYLTHGHVTDTRAYYWQMLVFDITCTGFTMRLYVSTWTGIISMDRQGENRQNVTTAAAEDLDFHVRDDKMYYIVSAENKVLVCLAMYSQRR